MKRILIVEDTRDIALGLRQLLEREQFAVRIAETGRAAIPEADVWRPDVVILDLMLPDLDGFEVLRRLRSRAHDMPVLILSARTDEVSKVEGFRVGADDYVTKPFGQRELVARLRSLVRRAEGARALPERLLSAEIELFPTAGRVLRNGAEVELRPREFALLVELMSHPDTVVSREALLDRAWGYEPGVASRTVDWHVAELRRKLGDEQQALITTIRRRGYRWTAPVQPLPAEAPPHTDLT